MMITNSVWIFLKMSNNLNNFSAIITSSNYFFLSKNRKSNIVESVKRQTEKEIISLRAQLKKAEMKYNSLQNQLEQKNQENQELHSMIDELTK